jgi:hypothetical protein
MSLFVLDKLYLYELGLKVWVGGVDGEDELNVV